MSPVRPVLPARLDLNSVEVWGSLSTPTLPAPETDEWDVASLDLDAYLDRVGHPAYSRPRRAEVAAHEAHVRAIAFENVDVVRVPPGSLGRTLRELDVDLGPVNPVRLHGHQVIMASVAAFFTRRGAA
jgi:hypothetical protein